MFKKLSLFFGIFAMVLSLTACSGQSVKEIDVQAVVDQIFEKADKGEIMLGMSDALDANGLKDFYGIDANDLDAYYVNIPMVNIQASEFAIFKAKPGKLDAIKQGVEKRVADLEDVWSRYLPDQYELVKNHQTWENGDYYFFVINENADVIMQIFKDAFN